MKRWSLSQKISFLVIATLIALIDQLIKIYFVTNFYEGQSKVVIEGFFNFVLLYNPGVAFGVFGGISEENIRLLVLGVTTSLALGVVYFFSNSPIGESKLGRFSLSLIVGGAIGNATDRILLGKVVDYLDFYYKNYHYPAFNFADSCIFIAVVILLFLPNQK
jgi:signal peptidase II